jgi:lipopolysaccharide/colanic/teichoic acid biosynthesis glycosyltransferase
VRRGIDILVAVTAGLVLMPLMVLVGLAVGVGLGRPLLFRQWRSGRGGQEFRIVKFRTMRSAAFPGEPDSSRDTRLGRTLRAVSLDELPQLWNVLIGDMSLIGPRPTLPEQVAQYSARQRGRLAIRPGITGWAQVSGRNSLSWPERIELDLWYIEHRSLSLDLRIIGRTAVQIVKPHGLYGEGGVNPGFPQSGGEPPDAAPIVTGSEN